MARKKSKTPKPQACPESSRPGLHPQPIRKAIHKTYTARISAARLEEKGFDPRVTSSTPQEVLNSWLIIHDRMMKKPKAPQQETYIGVTGLKTRSLTQVGWVSVLYSHIG